MRLPARKSNGFVDGVTIQEKTPFAGTLVVYSSLSSTRIGSPGLMQSWVGTPSGVAGLTSVTVANWQTGLDEVLKVFFRRRMRPAGARP